MVWSSAPKSLRRELFTLPVAWLACSVAGHQNGVAHLPAGVTSLSFPALRVHTESTDDGGNESWALPVNLMVSQSPKVDKLPLGLTAGFRAGPRCWAQRSSFSLPHTRVLPSSSRGPIPTRRWG